MHQLQQQQQLKQQQQQQLQQQRVVASQQQSMQQTPGMQCIMAQIGGKSIAVQIQQSPQQQQTATEDRLSLSKVCSLRKDSNWLLLVMRINLIGRTNKLFNINLCIYGSLAFIKHCGIT